MVHGLHLTRTSENVSEIEALGGLLGGPAGLKGLLGNLKYRAQPSSVPRLLGRAVDQAWRWNDYDCHDQRWWPQGISSSADAADSEEYDGRRLLVATWYAKDLGTGSFGSRVTFLDLDTLRYRHVLLVEPYLDRDGALALRPLRIHAGGIVWRGPYLHVAATSRGFYTCHVDDVMRVEGDDEWPDRFGVEQGRVASYGHRFVLPVRFAYRARAEPGRPGLRFSFLSLDRATSPPSLLAGEYGRGKESTRLARFELDGGTSLLVPGDDERVQPAWLDDRGVRQMQGAVTAKGRYYITVSRGTHWPGTVFVGKPGSLTKRPLAVPVGPEDISYWPSTDRLWSLTEHPGRRWLFSMKRNWFD
ncbi:hypothetical protein [Nocardioides sp.]|uniref:hypothetical protein n=1 Tax=Nocardioides sp. TaxID=35761 RepID=UPI002ED231DD